MTTLATPSIPVIDIKNLYNETNLNLTDSKIESVADKIGKALHECGFAYLVNHGVPENLISEAFTQSKSFFELPQEIKVKYSKKDVSKDNHGYVQPGQEQFNNYAIPELRESFDLFGNNRHFPTKAVPHFQTALENLEEACRTLNLKLLQLLALSIKLEDPLFFNNASQGLIDPKGIPSLTTFRTLFYPPIGENVVEGAVRCGEHTDYGTITLLFQDPVGGLQVKSAQKEWVEAHYVPNSILINTGDLLEAWTGGYFPATPHRVLVPETEIKKRISRQSIAYFLHPDDHVLISPLESQVVQKSADYDSYIPVTAYDHAMKKLNDTYKDV